MKIFPLFGLICCFSIYVFAQFSGSLTGRITQDNQPVAGAAVQITIHGPGGDKTFTTVSDAMGVYRFDGLKPGKHMIIAEGVPGKGIASGIVEIVSQNTPAFDMELTMAGYDAFNSQPRVRESVTISADAEQPLDEVSKSVSVISAQEMRDRADITLVDSLRTVPGFRMQQLGGFGRTASIKSRGLRNQDTAILIDGMRLRDAASTTGDATAFISDLTLTSVSHVEVLRGPGSSLYGTNAIGGTVDLQTPTPQSGWHGQVSGAAGGLGLGRFRGNISKGTSDRRFGFNVALSRTIYTKGIDGDDEARNTNFQSRIEFSPSSRSNISARFFFSDAFAALNSSPDTFGTLPLSSAVIIDAAPGANFVTDANDPDNSQKSRFFSGHVVVKHAFSSTLGLQASYQGLTTRRNNTNGPLGIRSQPFSGAKETDLFRGRIHTLNAQLDWTPAGGHRTTVGYEFESELFENDHITINVPDNFSARARQAGHTIFAQQMLNFFDGRLQMSGAFRVQTFSLDHPEFTPFSNPTYENLTLEDPPTAYTSDASASYFFRSSGTKIRVHAGNGYRVPSLFERFGSFYSDLFGFSSSGNPYLKPERSAAFDAGVDQSLYAGRLRLSGTYFYTDIRDSIDFGFCVPQCLPSPDPLGRFSGYFNSEGRVARGIETSAEIKPSGSTSISGSYTFTNSDERNPLNLAVQSSPGITAHTFTAVVTQRIGKQFWINADFVATSSYLFPFFNFDPNTFESRYLMYRFKGGRRLDLTAGYTFPINKGRFSLRLFGTVENVLGYEYYENGFLTIGRTGRIGLSLAF